MLVGWGWGGGTHLPPNMKSPDRTPGFVVVCFSFSWEIDLSIGEGVEFVGGGGGGVVGSALAYNTEPHI